MVENITPQLKVQNYHLHWSWYHCKLAPQYVPDLAIAQHVHHLELRLGAAGMVSLLADYHLSQVAVLAHHFLLLLGEGEVVEEPVPHHLHSNFQLGVCSSKIKPTTLTGWRSLSAKSAAAAKAPLASYFGFTDCLTFNKL